MGGICDICLLMVSVVLRVLWVLGVIMATKEGILLVKRYTIREGIEKFVSEAYWYEGHENKVVDITARLVNYLHSQGVVFKVDKELPKPICNTCKFMTGQEFLDAGYVSVESLIGEE